MFESKHNRNKRNFKKISAMFGVKEGHTVYCDADCSFTHHEMLMLLVASKRNDAKTVEKFKQSVLKELITGWNKNGDIRDDCKYFRFPLMHWAAVYGKLSILQWLLNQGFDADVTNNHGETALHRLVACQAHERAVDPRKGRGRRYSLNNIVQVFTKVLHIFTQKSPQLLLRYDFVQRNTPLASCLKLLIENYGVCERLAQYHQALFKVLCDCLILLYKHEKLSEEFIRKGFALKDRNGDTIWHLAAMCPNEIVTSCFSNIMDSVVGFDLSISNSSYETPILVALKNNNQAFAALVEAYKFSNCSVPIVKLELLPDSEQGECSCENRSVNPSNNTVCNPISNTHDLSAMNLTDQCNSSSDVSRTEPSMCLDGSLDTVERSFFERPKIKDVIEQEKVVLTKGAENESVLDDESCVLLNLKDQDTYQNETEMEDTSTSQVSDVESLMDNVETVEIDKQIDMCVSVCHSMEGSELLVSNYSTGQCLPSMQEKPTHQSAVQDVDVLAKALQLADVNENEIVDIQHLPTEQLDNITESIKISPDSSSSSALLENRPKEPVTPPFKDNISVRGNNVTPVLLIKLLSEPDVSLKFQSLLKDVISDDTAKVDCTESKIRKLKSTKMTLDDEIKSSVEVLSSINEKKVKLAEEIEKLQREACNLQASEELIQCKLSHLREEHAKVEEQIEGCKSTCKRLKRRLSDCAGALIGLSPKSQKKC